MQMELKDFVSRTLAEIAEGVSDASKAAERFGAIVNPLPVDMRGEEYGYAKATDVEFTVGLSISDGTQTKGGIGVVAGVFALGSQGASNAASAATTHIKFTVSVILPTPVNRKPVQ